MAIEEDILNKIRPTEDMRRRAEAAAAELMDGVRKKAAELGISVEPIVVGSVAKGTALREPDIDVFMQFPPETTEADLEKNGLLIGESLVRAERRYAKHPYAHGVYCGFEVDIVPCYKVTDPTAKMSAVDRTPFHTEYVKAHLTTEQQKDQVRLVKAFLKGIGAYGAEVETEGFSGYMTELLVIKYGDFHGVLRAAAVAWRKGIHLAIDGQAPHSFPDTFVFIDPVDSSRNAGAAVSLEKLMLTIHAAREYIKAPSEKFFFPAPPILLSQAGLEDLVAHRETGFVGIVLPRPSVVDDILFSQVKKSLKAAVQLAESHGFKACAWRFFAHEGDILLLFEFEIHRLPRLMLHFGPPVSHPNSADFLQKWQGAQGVIAGPFIHDGKWAVKIERPYRTPGQLLAQRLNEASLGKDIMDAVAKSGFAVLGLQELLCGSYIAEMSEFLDRRFPWER